MHILIQLFLDFIFNLLQNYMRSQLQFESKFLLMQKGYFTPIKNIYSHHKKSTNSDVPQRQGDWVCLNCQNLNYSFRKMCNRCKTQTRQENQTRSVYSYYYYPKIQQLDTNNFFHNKPVLNEDGTYSSCSDGFQVKQFSLENKQNNPYQMNQCLHTPKKKKDLHSSENSKLDGLPCVSALVRKYQQKDHHTTLSKLKNRKISQSQQKDSFDHMKDNFQNIKVRDFDKLIQELNINTSSAQNSPIKQFCDDEDNNQQGSIFMQQLEESISKIII